jgi:NADH-quinone oxidoreductase subunit M
LLLVIKSNGHSMDWEVLRQSTTFSVEFQRGLFPVLFLGFAVLAGIVPLHTWAPTGHVAAPTAASMLLAGVVMKLGAYGCLRVAIGLLPLGAEYWSPWIAWLGAAGIVYGAVIALVQRDFKFVIGYSSISHMGFVILGLGTLTTLGLTGAVLQMVSHGLLAGLLFAVAGSLVYDRTHTRELAKMDRLMERMPGVGAVFVVAGLASMGLPGFSGFVAELHVLLGAWARPEWKMGVLVVAGLGVLLAFVYTLSVMHQAFFKASTTPAAEMENYAKLTWPERLGCSLLIGGTLYLGLFPGFWIDLIKGSVSALARVGG